MTKPNNNGQNSSSKFRIRSTADIEENLSSKRIAFTEYTGYSAEYVKANYRLGLSNEHELENRITINSSVNYSNKYFTGTYYCVFVILPFPQVLRTPTLGL